MRHVAVAILAVALMPGLAGCTRKLADRDCNQIAEQARAESQSRPWKIRSIDNVRETSRTENDARCAGDATLADNGTAPIYMRGTEDDGNFSVTYQATPYR